MLARVAEGIIAAVMLVAFGYGFIRFNDGPIHPCQTGYCGKQGQFHTAADYDAYVAWERSMLIIWPAGFLGLFLIHRRDRRK